MWQTFDIDGIVHKEFIPLGQTVNGHSEAIDRMSLVGINPVLRNASRKQCVSLTSNKQSGMEIPVGLSAQLRLDSNNVL